MHLEKIQVMNDTLIVPNIINDDNGKSLVIKGNDTNSGIEGEFNYITLSANDNNYRSIDLEVAKGSDDKIKVNNTSGTTTGSLSDGSIFLTTPQGGMGLNFNSNKLLHIGNGKIYLQSANTDNDALKLNSSGGLDIDTTSAVDINAGAASNPTTSEF